MNPFDNVAEEEISRQNGKEERCKDGIKTYVSKEVNPTDITHDSHTPTPTATEISDFALSGINTISRNINEKADVDFEGRKVCSSLSSNSLLKTTIYQSNKEISELSMSSYLPHKGSSSGEDQSKTGFENLRNVLDRISNSSALKIPNASHSGILTELKAYHIDLLNSHCDVLNSISEEKLNLIFGDKTVDVVKLKTLHSKLNSKIKLLEGNKSNQGAEDTPTCNATSQIIGESPSKSAYIANTMDMLVNKTDLNVPQQTSLLDSSRNSVSIVKAKKSVVPEQTSSLYGKENITSIKNIQETKKPQTIRGRVVIESDKHSFANKKHWAKGPSVQFSINIMDKTSEIQMTAFGVYVDQFFDSVEDDKTYTFSNFTVKSSDKQKASIHNFNLRFTKNTRIVPSHATDVPKLGFKFKSIASINRKNEMVDILAICKSYGELLPVTLKNGESGRARELFLEDYSDKIMVTLWGSNADNIDYAPGCVIALKRAKVTNWKGGSLNVPCLSSATFKINPDTDEAHALTKWYEEKTAM